MPKLASLPEYPTFCSSVSVDNNSRKQKGGEKWGRPGRIHHVSDRWVNMRWT